MITRISDLRIAQAQQHGCIVGLPREDAVRIALAADLLCSCTAWPDVQLACEGLHRHDASTWAIPIDPGWTLLFEWIPGFGAVCLRLH